MVKEVEAIKCLHHWIIEPATGPKSQGVCRLCHEVKDFQNYVERSNWAERVKSTEEVDEIDDVG